MALLAVFRHHFHDDAGAPLNGGKLYFYEAGTSTLKDTYTTSAGTTPNANPVILNSRGEATVFTDGLYKVDLKTSADVQVTGYPVDNVGASSAASAEANMRWCGTSTGSANTQVLSPTTSISAYVIGQTFVWKAGYTNSGAATIAISGLDALGARSSGAAMDGTEMTVGRFYFGVLDTLTTIQVKEMDNAGDFLAIKATTGTFSGIVRGNTVTGTTTEAGVVGVGSTSGSGVYGVSTSGYGVSGTSVSSYGVYGLSTSGYGLYGTSTSGYGMYGTSADSYGVYGTSTISYGVYGTSSSSSGVYGISTSGYGVSGTSTSNNGVYGISTSSIGVYGASTSGHGMYGISTSGYGLYGTSTSNVGVYGSSSSSIGVYGRSTDSYGVVAESDTTSPAKAAFRIVPQDAQPTGANAVGDIYVTTAGVLKICTAAGTPGTWVSVGAQT